MIKLNKIKVCVISTSRADYGLLRNTILKIHFDKDFSLDLLITGSHNNKTPVFEICNDCGNVEEHLDQELTLNINKLSSKTGFKPNNQVLEIHGQCGDCAS